MKILHSADWHIGTFRSPEKDGVNLRSIDTEKCLEEMVCVARREHPDYALISGDIFHVGKLWSERCCDEILTAHHYISELAAASGHVVVMRGTPNHDGAGQFDVLREMFSGAFPACSNVTVATMPQVLRFDDLNIAVLPGFDRGEFRAKHPGIAKEEENEVFAKELSNIVIGLKAQCEPGKRSVLMAHYTVPGCNTESGQMMMLAQFEPVIPQETLMTADFDLVALGHIHRPQRVAGQNWYYSGAINALNFNDEGQERGFYIHEMDGAGSGGITSTFHRAPAREFLTLKLDDADITAINHGSMDSVAISHWRMTGDVAGKIVRIRYSCTAENAKAYKANEALVERTLLDDGAFMLWENLPEKVEETANREELAGASDPEMNLISYLEEKEMPPDKIQELVLKARPIIATAEADMPMAANAGTFVPVEISVRNYRNYEDETFNFEDISFCTINGENGAGKSSLFMDAILDCLYEEPREGTLRDDNKKPVWLRNDEKARSGSISFTFRVGEKTYRVTRTRARSGSGTLNLSELVDGEWCDRSEERYNDTQQKILNTIGMDSLTFRSCALIMQDQYGIFLQAKPEERIEVLGTLLGLEVYRSMEKLAQETARAWRSGSQAVKQEIEIHAATIAGLGNPEAELKEAEADLEKSTADLNAKIDARDTHQLLLAHQQEAAERRGRLLESCRTLNVKKRERETDLKANQATFTASSRELDERPEIEAKVAEYHSLEERERKLAAEAALYSAKKAEAEETERQARHEEDGLGSLNANLSRLERKKEELETPMDEERIRKDAEDYEKCSVRIRELGILYARHSEALRRVAQKTYALKNKESYISQEQRRLVSIRTDLERRVALLQNSGCTNADNAGCRFLADALAAKKQLPELEANISAFNEKEDAEMEKLKAELDEAEKAAAEIGYDQTERDRCEDRLNALRDAPQRLREMEARAHDISLISAQIDNTRSNISECEKRLAEARRKAVAARQEADAYAESYREHEAALESMGALKPWLEKEKQLPVWEMKKTNSAKRITEQEKEIADIDAEISEKQEEADRELPAMDGMEDLRGKVAILKADARNAQEAVDACRMKIGGLMQKKEQAEALKKEIRDLQEQQAEASKEQTDYETLKAAFSQSGIPHQIIRSVIPQLTATANSILGQMTGGKMGVEFRLERKQMNGKEKAALDIFIEESGKHPLPYLSKSGGEKVKSSLSVILALAEMKSTTVGVQLGMLFIDEPPFLDADGIQAYCDALETIQSRYQNIKIMAITHDPTMKARFPQSLDVVKTDEGSKVVY